MDRNWSAENKRGLDVIGRKYRPVRLTVDAKTCWIGGSCPPEIEEYLRQNVGWHVRRIQDILHRVELTRKLGINPGEYDEDRGENP